ncbi:MAG TPA: DUF5915 domain-containing protein, partial [Anaerolineales bacterium]|nr:DUF5915 domain-containing protein [Anaerolineales bacterium]
VVDPQAAVATLRSGRPLTLHLEDQEVKLLPSDVMVTPQPKSGFAVKAEGEYVVALDTVITPELRAEGWAREVVRRIQDLRKTAGFDIADRITTYYLPSEGVKQAIETYADYIKGETLSVRLEMGDWPEGAATGEDEFDGEKLALGLLVVKAQRAEPKAQGRERVTKKARAKAKPKTKAKTVRAKPKAPSKKTTKKSSKPKAKATRAGKRKSK